MNEKIFKTVRNYAHIMVIDRPNLDFLERLLNEKENLFIEEFDKLDFYISLNDLVSSKNTPFSYTVKGEILQIINARIENLKEIVSSNKSKKQNISFHETEILIDRLSKILDSEVYDRVSKLYENLHIKLGICSSKDTQTLYKDEIIQCDNILTRFINNYGSLMKDLQYLNKEITLNNYEELLYKLDWDKILELNRGNRAIYEDLVEIFSNYKFKKEIENTLDSLTYSNKRKNISLKEQGIIKKIKDPEKKLVDKIKLVEEYFNEQRKIENFKNERKMNDQNFFEQKSFNCNLKEPQFGILTQHINQIKLFEIEINTKDLNDIINCNLTSPLKILNVKLLVYLFDALDNNKMVSPEWQDVIGHYKLFISKRGTVISRENLYSQRSQMLKDYAVPPRGAKIVDQAIKEIKKLKTI